MDDVAIITALRNALIHVSERLEYHKKTLSMMREDAEGMDSVQILDCAICYRPTLFGGSEPGSNRDANYFVCHIPGCRNIYCRECIRDHVVWLDEEAREGWCHDHHH
jgi:hypothetical protein